MEQSPESEIVESTETRDRGFWMAGPCSAETEEQVIDTAKELANIGIDVYRAGVWKPRTRPNSFEGNGSKALEWLKNVKSETGLNVCTEVAKAEHVEACLNHGIDTLWIGARTTVSPFAVQEIADSLKGVDAEVFIKNPINPDAKLWIGAAERIEQVGIEKIGLIHRGFNAYDSTAYRNQPMWQIAIEVMQYFPEYKMICDTSHISGKRSLIGTVAQKALDLNYNGIMVEVHPNPDQAWSDAQQQITPSDFQKLKSTLTYRDSGISNRDFLVTLEGLRDRIDDIDSEIIALFAKRMGIADAIGGYKKKNNIAILQKERWANIVARSLEQGAKLGLTEEFVQSFLRAVHDESIHRQHQIMNKSEDE